MGSAIRHLLSSIKRVDQEYSLIQQNDRILCPIVSSCPDVSLFECLAKYRYLSKKEYTLIPLFIDDGYKKDFASLLAYLINDGVDLLVYDASFIKPSLEAYKTQGRKNLSSIYRRLIRNAMIDAAKEHHCNKIAVSSTYSEALESFFLHLFYHGSVSTFLPKSALNGKGISFIRPFYYAEEEQLTAFIKEQEYPFSSFDSFSQENVLVKEMIASFPLTIQKNLARLLKEESEGLLPSLEKEYEIFGTPYSVRPLHLDEGLYPLFETKIPHKENQEAYVLIKDNHPASWIFFHPYLNHYLEIDFLKGKEEDKLLLLSKIISLKSEEIHPLNVILLNQKENFALKAGFQKKYEIAYRKEKWSLRIKEKVPN